MPYWVLRKAASRRSQMYKLDPEEPIRGLRCPKGSYWPRDANAKPFMRENAQFRTSGFSQAQLHTCLHLQNEITTRMAP